MLLKKYLILLNLLIPVFCAGQQYVTLFENCNFSGKSYVLEPGNYRVYEMKIKNDQLSSIQVPNGMKITIYENNDFKGKSKTFISNIACLDSLWNDMASSIAVESTLPLGYNPNDYVVFYTDCYAKGYSRSFSAGTYTGANLGQLKDQISSFAIYGNLRVKLYTTNDDATGYSVSFEEGQSCLGKNYNDKIKSLVIEYNPNGGATGTGGNSSDDDKVSLFEDCYMKGNSMNLGPGQYKAEQLGMFRNSISSIEVPSHLLVKAFTSSDYLYGTSYTISESSGCLSYNLNDRIASLIIEEKGYTGNTGNLPPGAGAHVMIYTDAEFKGFSAVVMPGTYASMAQLGFPAKSLSSIYVPDGFYVVLYELENFKGKSYTVQQTKSRFYISNWNDRTASIGVYRKR